MKRLAASNPGIRSRFATTISFPDYTAEELMAITDAQLADEQLVIALEARASLGSIFRAMVAARDRECGNGRAVRNLLERAKREQALRLVGLPGKKSKEQLMLLLADDFAPVLGELGLAGR